MSGPGWDLDLPYGTNGEKNVAEVMGLAGCRVEVKTKRRHDDWLYVELEQNPFGRGWRPSGLNITTLTYWAFCVDDTGILILIPVRTLKAIIRSDHGRPAQETDGECPTNGRLVRVSFVLSRVYGEATR